jgi:hypothetical protein
MPLAGEQVTDLRRQFGRHAVRLVAEATRSHPGYLTVDNPPHHRSAVDSIGLIVVSP